MLGKLIDGRLVVAGRIVKEGNTTITNPTEEKLKELGYKEIQYDLKPEYDKEEEKLVEMHKDCGTYIEVWYGKEQLTDEEHNDIINNKIRQKENLISVELIARALINNVKGTKDNSAISEIEKILNEIEELKKEIK